MKCNDCKKELFRVTEIGVVYCRWCGAELKGRFVQDES